MTKEDLEAYQGLQLETDQLFDQYDHLVKEFNRLIPILVTERYLALLREKNELADTILDHYREAKQAARRIEVAIRAIPDPKERVVLRYRYLQGLSWSKIGEQMHYSERQVHRIHGRALQHIKEW